MFKITIVLLFVGSAASEHKHNKTVHVTSSKPLSTDKTKSDTQQSVQHGSCRDGDKPAISVSTTNKTTVAPSFKISISGQVILFVAYKN